MEVISFVLWHGIHMPRDIPKMLCGPVVLCCWAVTNIETEALRCLMSKPVSAKDECVS